MSNSSLVIKVDRRDECLAEFKLHAARALEKCGLLAEGYAKVNITEQKAVDTGNLRNSLTHKLVLSEDAVYIGTNVNYAPYVEYGTGEYAEEGGRQTPWVYKGKDGNFYMTTGMKPRPYLRPAVSEHASEYKTVIEDEFKN